MKKVIQNLQKEGYMAPRAEAYEMMQEACILGSSNQETHLTPITDDSDWEEE